MPPGRAPIQLSVPPKGLDSAPLGHHPGHLPPDLDDHLAQGSRIAANSYLLGDIRHPLAGDIDGPLLEKVPGAAPGVLIGKCTHHQISGAKCTGRERDRGHIARQLPARKLLLKFLLSEVGALLPLIHANDAMRELLLGGHGIGLAPSERAGNLLDLGGRSVGDEPEIPLDEAVGEAHHLAVDLLRRLGDADVIAEALAHAADPVQALEDGQGQADLGLVVVRGLDVAARKKVELLLGRADLYIGAHHHGVICLHQRIEELVDADRLALREPDVEVVALQHSGEGDSRREPEDVHEAHGLEPVAVPAHLGLRLVDDLEELIEIGLRVRMDLRFGERGPGLRAAAGIPHERGVAAHDQDHLMPELLELTELSQSDRVTEMNVGSRGIESLLHAKRLLRCDRALELPDELLLGNQLFDSGANHLELPLDLGALGLGGHLAAAYQVWKARGSAAPEKGRRNWLLTGSEGAPSVPSAGKTPLTMRPSSRVQAG